MEMVESNWLAAVTRDSTVPATLEPSGDTVAEVRGTELTDPRLTSDAGEETREGVGLGGHLVAPGAAHGHDGILCSGRGEEGAEPEPVNAWLSTVVDEAVPVPLEVSSRA